MHKRLRKTDVPSCESNVKVELFNLIRLGKYDFVTDEIAGRKDNVLRLFPIPL